VLAQLKPPRTNVDFEAAWRTLKGDKSLQVSTVKWGQGQGYQRGCLGVAYA
jgi:hypothetical protein